ncbi:energy-coupling factor transporter transmembrane component T [Pseudoramibacter faecis]|uniref:energy-coupling factor transporter transmembrane component T n=1 Tax=Pseudoramibacter faecis TaxID=3108534 RepID=UPI002E78E432|nr:energy-coupling factor transporter transmembrane component T [Pseudoramibacter sp. HA2172]
MHLDPRTKLLILSITGVSVFLNERIVIECLFTAVPAFLLLQAKEFRTVSKYGIFFIVLLMIQLFVIVRLPVAVGGVIYMFDVYIRKLIPCFMLGAFLIRTTKVSAFLAALSRLHLPKGFTIALSVTLRYFPTMTEEWGYIKDAMALRGITVSFAGFLRHPLRTMEYVYVPMLVSASKISDEITQAAITRGIDHAGRRSCIEQVGFSIRDALIVMLYIGIICMIVFDFLRGGVFS